MDDDELREQLRRIDPAVNLTPLDPTEASRLLEDTMTEQSTTAKRSRVLLVIAAAAVVLIGLGGLLFAGDDDPTPPSATDPVATATPTSEPSPDPTSGESHALVLSAPTAVSGRCAVPSAPVLANAEVAFDGVVQEIDEDAIVLTPSLIYSGAQVDEVRVESPPEALAALIGAVEFQVGERYLVSAVDGQVTVCGFTGPYSADLERLYVDAFGG